MDTYLFQKQNYSISEPYLYNGKCWYTTTVSKSFDHQPVFCQLHWQDSKRKFRIKQQLVEWDHYLKQLPASFSPTPYSALSPHTQALVLRIIHYPDMWDNCTIQGSDPWWASIDLEALKTVKNDLRKLDQSYWGRRSLFQWEFYQDTNGLNIAKINRRCVESIHWDTPNTPHDILGIDDHSLIDSTDMATPIRLYSNSAPVKIENPYIDPQPSTPIPRCPTCSSTNIRKITAGEKAGGFALFGVFSRKMQKQFHCNSCGYEW